ncbi:hypothetical protein Pcinc_039223 [Petrolisthes cinctipes]|uniref:C2H2-type domain-containing protein n=1 Tax=Petrolisthes cinctipes TaxID=88211 RepID=A0AAE1BKT0_PETCI|nr:hypothetical protein Pcinc_040786 [Petrolisthes cinctipes]KAK3854282.1 hypothetical protein Pcinc_039223 [Petrolisthes cinctipes]
MWLSCAVQDRQTDRQTGWLRWVAGCGRAGTAFTAHFVAGGWYGRRQCDVCGKTLSSKYALQVHIRDVHTEVRRTFTCTLCNKVYASQNSYRVHMSIKHRQQHQQQQHLQQPQQVQQQQQPQAHHLQQQPVSELPDGQL